MQWCRLLSDISRRDCRNRHALDVLSDLVSTLAKGGDVYLDIAPCETYDRRRAERFDALGERVLRRAYADMDELDSRASTVASLVRKAIEEKLQKVHKEIRKKSRGAPPESLMVLGQPLPLDHYSYSLVINLHNPDSLPEVFHDGLIWMSRFVFFHDPKKDVRHLEDPHADLETFVPKVRWALCQEDSPEWLLTCSEPDCMSNMLEKAHRVFERHKLKLKVKPRPARGASDK